MSLRPIRKLEKSVAYLQSKPDPSNPKQYLINREPPIMNFTLLRPRLDISFLPAEEIQHLENFLTFDDLAKGAEALEDEGYLLDGYKEIQSPQYDGILKVRLCDDTGGCGSTHLEFLDFDSRRTVFSMSQIENKIIIQTFKNLKSVVCLFLQELKMPKRLIKNIDSRIVCFDKVRWTYFLDTQRFQRHNKCFELFSAVLKAQSIPHFFDSDEFSVIKYLHNSFSVEILSSTKCGDENEFVDQANFTYVPDSKKNSIIVSITLSGRILAEQGMNIESAWYAVDLDLNSQSVYDSAVRSAIMGGEFGDIYAPPTPQQIENVILEHELFESSDFISYLSEYFYGGNIDDRKFELFGKDALLRQHAREYFDVDLCVPFPVIRDWYKFNVNEIFAPKNPSKKFASMN